MTVVIFTHGGVRAPLGGGDLRAASAGLRVEAMNSMRILSLTMGRLFGNMKRCV
jgi:hypothetical protein